MQEKEETLNQEKQFYNDETLQTLADQLRYYELDVEEIYNAYKQSSAHTTYKNRDSTPPLEHVTGTLAEIIVNSYLRRWGFHHSSDHNVDLLRESYGDGFSDHYHETTGSITLYPEPSSNEEIDNLLFYTRSDGKVIPVIVEVKQGVGKNVYGHIKRLMRDKGSRVKEIFKMFDDVAFMIVIPPELETADDYEHDKENRMNQIIFENNGGILGFLPLSGEELQKFAKVMGKVIYGESLSYGS